MLIPSRSIFGIAASYPDFPAMMRPAPILARSDRAREWQGNALLGSAPPATMVLAGQNNQ
jgi:hypothetical protein